MKGLYFDTKKTFVKVLGQLDSDRYTQSPEQAALSMKVAAKQYREKYGA